MSRPCSLGLFDVLILQLDAQGAPHVCPKNVQSQCHIKCQLMFYANRDSFDLASFFQLHDLNRDGQWDKEEIEAVYGMHHEYSKSLSPNAQVQKERAEAVVKAVLDKVTTESFPLHLPFSLTPVPD